MLATNVAVLPAHTFAGDAMLLIEGLPLITITAAALLVLPHPLEAIKVKDPASVFAEVDNVNVLAIFPTSTPSFCHLNEVAPETSAERVMAAPTQTVDPTGCNVIIGLEETFICKLPLLVVPQPLVTSTV
jgi:hypothetical protein